MANYIVSYDLSSPRPTHQEMDKHLGSAGWTRARILETVWYVGADERTQEVFDHVNGILSETDRLMVVNAAEAFWRNLHTSDTSLQIAFHSSDDGQR